MGMAADLLDFTQLLANALPIDHGFEGSSTNGSDHPGIEVSDYMAFNEGELEDLSRQVMAGNSDPMYVV